MFPSSKYEFGSPGVRRGPGLPQLFGAVADHLSPGARLSILDALIFNILICNVDAHAKNYEMIAEINDFDVAKVRAEAAAYRA